MSVSDITIMDYIWVRVIYITPGPPIYYLDRVVNFFVAKTPYTQDYYQL